MNNKKITIGITDCGEKFRNYNGWIRSVNPEIEVVKLSYEANNAKVVCECDGIVLSGGHDVHPKFYGKQDYYPLLNQNNIDEKRDLFELNVIEQTQQNNKPMLGICRGLQIANVFFGGTLIRDIPSHLKINWHDRGEDENDSHHHIHVKSGSLLFDISGKEEGEVNSAHHQSADKIADGLISNSNCKEGVIEGLEWKDDIGKPPLLLVQWHPERMMNQESGFAKSIRDYFLKEAGNRK